MKLKKAISWRDREYDALSDSSQELDSKTLLVKTPLNVRYTQGLFGCSDSEAASFFDFKFKLIGITGTNGKSSTSFMLAHGLAQMGFRVGIIGTCGAFLQTGEHRALLRPKGLTTPTFLQLYSILDELAGADYVVMEISSHAIVQERICGLKFYAKFLLNITQDHLDFHGSMEEYARVKNSFLRSLDSKNAHFKSFLNADDGMIERQKGAVLIGRAQKYEARDIKLTPFLRADFCIDGGLVGERRFHLIGAYNACNLLFAWAFLCEEFGRPKKMLKALENFKGVPGRGEIVSLDPLIIIDFAHTPDGMKSIFESLKDRKISVVFGAGGNRDSSKRPLMGEMADKYAQKIFLTSDNPRDEEPMEIISEVARGIKGDFRIYTDRAQAIRQAISDALDSKNAVLILGKGDEHYQEIKGVKHPFDDKEVARAALECILQTPDGQEDPKG